MEYFPLSLSQQNILNLERIFPGTSVNNISTTVRIKGNLDFRLLQESIHLVLEKDASINTRLTEQDGKLVQYHVPYVREDFPVYDFSNTSREGIENWEIAVTREPIPLDGPLYRFILFQDGEGSGGILVKLHHIIADGWSQIMLCNKLANTYLELLGGKEITLAEAPDYKLHVEEEQQYLASKAYTKDEAYWKDIISKSGEPSVLKSVNSAAVSPVGRRVSFELPQILNHAIYSYCQEKRVAPFAVFYMALAIYFKRIGGAERFTIGVPIFNRTNYKFKQTTGMFVTTLPFYNEINDEWTLNQFNDSLMESWYDMLRHQRYPFSKINELAGRDDRLFHIALSYQDSKIFEGKDVSVHLSGRWHYCGYQAEQLTIHLTNLFEHQKYAIDYDYLAQFFAEEEILNLHKNLCEIMNEALSDPDKPIHKLRVLSMEQKERLLYTFNQTDRYLREVLVYESLVENSAEYQNRVAVICDGERMTYGALLYKSAGYACAISRCEVEREDLVAILLPRKAELLAAMVGSLQADCAYVVLSEELPPERIRNILKQSGAKVLITTEKSKRRIGVCDVDILTAEEISVSGNFFFMHNPKADQDDKPLSERLAYVVYTSGSTGEPKGVEITHRNLLNLAQEMKEIYGQGAVLSVCNVGFDAFMLESMVALLNGRTIVFPGEEDLESPEKLASLITGHAVGSIFITPSRLSSFLKSSPFVRAMRKLECIVCGGEAFPAELLKKLKKYSNAKIYNQYGPSETTVGVSIKELSKAERITAGRPMGNCRLYVLDKWMNPLPVGGYGSLYVGGKCVGRGYRNRPDLTDKSFCPNPFVTDDRLYYTGDMACWTPDGEILLTGRLDDQVKLRGLRVELQEISSCIETYPGITAAVTAVCEVNGQQVLGAYYCAEEVVNEAGVLAYVATYLPKYMIPAFLMRLEELPVSSNGKVDTRRLPLPVLPSGDDQVSLTPLGTTILNVFRQVLQVEEIYGNSDYFLLGGNSLNAMECVMRIEEETGRRVRIADLYACRTAARVAAYLEGGSCGQNAPSFVNVTKPDGLKKAPKRGFYELSPTQQGMYIQSLLDPNGLSYNMPGAFLLEEEPDQERLLKAFRILLQEEPILRTAYIQSTEGLRACVQEEVPFEIEFLEAENFQDACRAFLRPFDLAQGRLLRAALWYHGGQCYLFLDSHHIAGDGMSTPLLLTRLNQAYGEGTFRTEWNYYDYLYSLEQEEKQTEKENELSYWTGLLKDLPEPLKLPSDFGGLTKFDYKGTDYIHSLSEETTLSIDSFCQERGISSFVLFLASYGILLAAVTGREDFVIGAPVAGRTKVHTQDIIGPFINTLPLRLQPGGQKKTAEWLNEVQSLVTGMLDHQHVSLEEIIQALKLPRGEQNALYQVMLTQSPVNEDAFVLGGKKMIYHSVSTGSVKMDLILEMAKNKRGYSLHFSYATGIFKEETIAFYARCFEQIMLQLMTKGEHCIEQLSLMSPADYQHYVEIPNYEVTPFMNLPVHKILKNRAVQNPDDTAIIFHGEQYSYRWLEGRAGAIARFIEEKGIPSGAAIGLCMTRTPDMIAAMYGVLKAGCAYEFMLPTFPEARLGYMLEISEAPLLFYDEEALKKMPEGFVFQTGNWEACEVPKGYDDTYEDRKIRQDSLANILFTSGSTGKPKGVMLRHRSLSNLYSQMKTTLETIEGRVLCSTNTVFDCFVVETIIAIALGRCVVLADEEEMMLPWKLAHLVETYETGIFEMTPSRLQMCLGNDAFCKAASHIRIVLLGGEVVTKTLLDKFTQHSDGILMNMYGPTEATVFTTMEPLKSGEHITIGRPLQNTRTYVLNDRLQPVIPTACGELYIAGECLAAGYVGRPDLTESAFIDDIYFPGEKMYRSGDLVRLRVDGRFDYVARKDAQVKLNGQRVELGEITGAILECEHVLQAAVVPVRKEDGSMELCAFYQMHQDKISDTDIVKEEILTHIRKVLPIYMVPSRILPIGRMPMTATNKIDMQQLLKYATGEEPYEAAEENCAAVEISCHKKEQAGETAGNDAPSVKEINTQYVLNIWNKVLSVPATETDVSFFDLGGTSMGALTVMSHYFNDHLEMTMARFYENPTAAGQAAYLAANDGKNRKDSFKEAGQEAQSKAALITGATGFFGVHLAKELLNQNRPILCLLRDGSAERMKECLEWYFGPDFYELHKEYVTVVKGDISKEKLGMDDDEFKQLSEQIGEIYHSAADVRHYVAESEEYLNTNVGGTEHMIELAKTAGAAFYYMSTCSVSGDHFKDHRGAGVFTEEDYDIGQIWEENIYVRSKFLAEGLVFQAGREGLPVKIFRLGRLVGRAEDGLFQKNPESNVFYLLMKGFCQIEAIPEGMEDSLIDLMPVDVAAQEVLLLTKAEGKVYHIMSHNPPTLENVVKAMNGNVQVASNEKMTELLMTKASEMKKEQIGLLVDHWRRAKFDRPEIDVLNHMTMEELRRLGFQPDIPGPEQLLKGF